MPGIVGLIGKLRREDGVRSIQRMLDAVTYESFYLSGAYVDENLGFYVGWTAHPDSFCARLPARSQDGRVALFFAGEVFNGSARRDPESSPEAHGLVEPYVTLGDRFYGELNGTFSGLIADSHSNRVKLFNDRLGYEKIYYNHDDETGVFYFASEAKAILRVLAGTREFDRRGLAEFLRFGCTFNERTLYSGLSRLPPASVWEFSPRNSTPRKSTYFSPTDWQTNPSLTSQAVQTDFLEIFTRVLPEYSDTPGGCALSLTGGWDTRMILAAKEFQPGSLPCYTFAGFSGDTVDVRQARKVADSVGQAYSVVRFQRDFLEKFPEHAEKTAYVSDGYGGICLTHEIYLNRIAREISRVRLTGNFGSEVFRGVSTFKELPLQTEWYRGELSRELGQVQQEWRDPLLEKSSARFAVFREIPWKLATSLRLANSQLQIRTPYLDNELLRLACASPPNISGMFRPAVLVQCLRPALLEIPTDRGESGADSGFAEVLRRIWYKGTFKLDYWATEGTPDFLAYAVDRWRANTLLPVRHKYLDYRQWLRGPLRGYTEDLLNDSNAFVAGLVGRDVVRRILNDHQSGSRNTLPDLSALMNLELIHKCLLLKAKEPKARELTSWFSVNNLVETNVPPNGN
jgi:asparagine synthase (glutamine-hydrolysing)